MNIGSHSSILFSYTDQSNIEKRVIWADDFIEINCNELSHDRSHSFRISTAAVSAMIQRFHYDIYLLWKLLADSVLIYEDRVIFSTQHILNFPTLKDSRGRSAWKIYETSKPIESGNFWKIEFLTNIDYPFDLEIRVQLSPQWERRHIYRMEGYLLKPYFEKYCMEIYMKKHLHTHYHFYHLKQLSEGEVEQQKPEKEILEAKTEDKGEEMTLLKPKEKEKDYSIAPNFMLNSLVNELIYNKESDELLIKSVEIIRLEEFLDKSKKNPGMIIPANKGVTFDDSDNDDNEEILDQGSLEEDIDDDQEDDEENEENSVTDEKIENIAQNPEKEQIISKQTFKTLSSNLQLMPENKPPPLEKYEQFSDRNIDGSGNYNQIETIAPLNTPLGSNKSILRRESQFTENKSNQTKDGKVKIVTPNSSRRNTRDNLFEKPITQEETNKKMNTSSNISNNSNKKDLKIIPSSSIKKLAPDDLDWYTFEQSISITNRMGEIQNKLNDIVDENKSIINNIIRETNLMLNNPMMTTDKDRMSWFKNKQPIALVTSVDSETKNRVQLMKEALVIKPDLRSNMSTKLIIKYLKKNTRLGNYLTNCSHLDLQALAHAATLVSISPKDQTKLTSTSKPSSNAEKVLGIYRGDPISYVYIIIYGILNVERIKESHEYSDFIHPDYQQNTPVFESIKQSSEKAKLQKQETVVDRLEMGDILGENALNSGYSWNYDIISAEIPESNENFESNVLVCQLPINIVNQYIGRRGPEVEDYVSYFWKMLRLYVDIKDHNKNLFASNLYKTDINSYSEAANKSSRRFGDSSKLFGDDFSPMNVIESARLRIFTAGSQIFAQEDPRHFLYIMKQGSATYFRIFPSNEVGIDIIPEKVETIPHYYNENLQTKKNTLDQVNSEEELKHPLTNIDTSAQGDLLSDDFSIFDSEDIFVIDRIEDLDQHYATFTENKPKKNTNSENSRSLLSTEYFDEDDETAEAMRLKQIFEEEEAAKLEMKTSNEMVRDYIKRQYSRFEHHKNTLQANTRCEVVVIPIQELIKSVNLLRKLITISNIKYPLLLTDNEAIIKNYHTLRLWYESERYEYLHNILLDKISKKLTRENYSYTDTMINSYMNEFLYSKKHPFYDYTKYICTKNQNQSDPLTLSRPGTSQLPGIESSPLRSPAIKSHHKPFLLESIDQNNTKKPEKKKKIDEGSNLDPSASSQEVSLKYKSTIASLVKIVSDEAEYQTIPQLLRKVSLSNQPEQNNSDSSSPLKPKPPTLISRSSNIQKNKQKIQNHRVIKSQVSAGSNQASIVNPYSPNKATKEKIVTENEASKPQTSSTNKRKEMELIPEAIQPDIDDSINSSPNLSGRRKGIMLNNLQNIYDLVIETENHRQPPTAPSKSIACESYDFFDPTTTNEPSQKPQQKFKRRSSFHYYTGNQHENDSAEDEHFLEIDPEGGLFAEALAATLDDYENHFKFTAGEEIIAPLDDQGKLLGCSVPSQQHHPKNKSKVVLPSSPSTKVSDNKKVPSTNEVDKLAILTEIFYLHQNHEPPKFPGRTLRSEQQQLSTNNNLKLTPEDFVKLYKERLSNNPNQRFLDEFYTKMPKR